MNPLQAKDAEASAATAQAAQLQEQAARAAAQGDSAQAAQLHEAAAAAAKEAVEAQQLAAIAFAEAGRPPGPQAVQAATQGLPDTPPNLSSVNVPAVPSQLQLVTSLSDSMQQTMKLLMARGRKHGDMQGTALSDGKGLQSVAAWASPQAAVGPLGSGQTAPVEGKLQ